MICKPDAPPARIMYQSYVDETLGGPYLTHLRRYLDSVKASGTEVTVKEITPPDSYGHPLVEYRCGRIAIQNAIRAERDGFDAVVLGHIQDSGLWEARAAVSIPVLGLGEVCYLHACMHAAHSGVVTINPRFIPGFKQQIRRYGLERRVPHVLAIEHQPGDFMHSFDSTDSRQRVIETFRVQAEKLVDQGVEVIIPGGGIPMLLLADAGVRSIAGAPVLDGLAVLVKAAEMAVSLHRRGNLAASRVADFKLPPDQVLDEFLEH